jgi:hypothetical protein
MNAQDFHSFQEAYNQMYEVGEELTGSRKQRSSDLLNKKLRDVETLRNLSSRKRETPKNLGSGNRAKRRAGQEVKDSRLSVSDSYEYDLYDIVLSYLLDEGYAESQESAEAIMVSMSEEWREEICEKKVPWNDPDRPLQSGHTPAEKNRAKRSRTGVENTNKYPSEKDYARYGRMKLVDDEETSKSPKQKKGIFGRKKPLKHDDPHEFKKNKVSRETKEPITKGQERRKNTEKYGLYQGSTSQTPIHAGDTRKRTSRRWGGPNPRELDGRRTRKSTTTKSKSKLRK